MADWFVAALTTFGHMALWTTLINRLHSLPLPRPLLKCSQAAFLVVFPAGVILIPMTFLLLGGNGESGVAEVGTLGSRLSRYPLFAAYALICCTVALVTFGVWIVRRLRPLPKALLSNHTRQVDVAERLGRRPVSGWRTELLARVPGNQVFRLDVNEKRVRLGRLPAALDGLTIAHISDLHFTGKLTQDFYQQVVEETNSLDADMIAVTGDILDTMRCLDWIESTLGRLRAPCGVYVILGNHDRVLHNAPTIRRALVDAGLIELGGRWHAFDHRGAHVVLAGNEHPWFGPRPRAEDCPAPAEDAESLRILLSHSPDQIPWARRMGFDLMLAGHNHGGQIRLPIIGPIVSPSVYGVKYASGLFDEPPTLLHVSRGVGEDKPIRLNCPPEITKLVLARVEA